jgi:transposase
MALRRRGPSQEGMWLASTRVAAAPGHRFYEKLNELLKKHEFDRQVEDLCVPFYKEEGTVGRPSVPPGTYFRMLLVGYFEGIESERGICWRCADSLSLRSFLGLAMTESVPDQSTLSRIRKRLPKELFEQVFKIVLKFVASEGLLKGKVAGVDSTYLRADASMKSIVRRDSGEQYADYIRGLAEAEEGEGATAEDATRLDRKRSKKTSNAEWKSSTDEDARIARLKDGRTRLAYKAEHVVDLETDAIIDAKVHVADVPDAATLVDAAERARERIERAHDDDDDDNPTASTSRISLPASPVIEIVADKGYHKAIVIRELTEKGFRTFLPERKQSGQRRWTNKGGQLTADAFHANRARTRRAKGRARQRLRGEHLERSFAFACETGAMRRVRLRGKDNVSKRWVIHAAAQNLGLVMRKWFGYGTPRGLAAALAAVLAYVFVLMDAFVRTVGFGAQVAHHQLGSRSQSMIIGYAR